MKRFLSCLLSCSLLLGGSGISVSAKEVKTFLSTLEYGVLSKEEIQQRIDTANTAAWCFIDRFTGSDFTPPEYFAGFSFTEQGGIAMYITDLSYCAEALAICRGTEMSKNVEIDFIKAEHSFNTLLRKMEEIRQLSWIKDPAVGAYSLSIDIPHNRVEVAVTSRAMAEALSRSRSLSEYYRFTVAVNPVQREPEIEEVPQLEEAMPPEAEAIDRLLRSGAARRKAPDESCPA